MHGREKFYLVYDRILPFVNDIDPRRSGRSLLQFINIYLHVFYLSDLINSLL